jgi:rare lipoprotein A
MDAYREWMVGVLIATAVVLLFVAVCSAETGQASWYSYQSCVREGTSGVFTATGERFNENDFTCAMPNRSMFGKMVRVTNLDNGKSVTVRCNDYGPAKRLVKKGRIIDLSKGAFAKIASLKRGLIFVRIEVLNG